MQSLTLTATEMYTLLYFFDGWMDWWSVRQYDGGNVLTAMAPSRCDKDGQ